MILSMHVVSKPMGEAKVVMSFLIRIPSAIWKRVSRC